MQQTEWNEENFNPTRNQLFPDKRESLFLCEINRVLFSPHSPHKV